MRELRDRALLLTINVLLRRLFHVDRARQWSYGRLCGYAGIQQIARLFVIEYDQENSGFRRDLATMQLCMLNIDVTCSCLVGAIVTAVFGDRLCRCKSASIPTSISIVRATF